MKKRLPITLGIILAASLGLTSGCNDDKTPPAAEEMPVVKTLTAPSDNARLELETLESQVFSWDAATPASTAAVTYEVLFDTENGDFSSPIRVYQSALNGAETSVELSSSSLNAIAVAAGADKGEEVTVKWTVRTKRGEEESLSEVARKIVIVRDEDDDNGDGGDGEEIITDPVLSDGESLFIAGEGSESGQQFKPVEQDGKTVYEIYTRIEADKPYYFTSELEGKERYFSLDPAGDSFVEIVGGEPSAATVSHTGVYRMTVDFSDTSIKLESIDRVTLRMSFDMTHTDFTYREKGVWEIKDHQTQIYAAPWGIEERYCIVFTVDGENEHWGQFGPLFGSRPAIDREGYRDMAPIGTGQYHDWHFKLPVEICDIGVFDYYIVDVVLSMTAEGNYTHDFENKRTHSEVAFTNPIFTEFSLPDPDVIRGEDGYFYLYATEHSLSNPNMKNAPIMRSSNLIDWERVGSIFTDENHPNITNRETTPGIWAPSVHKIGDKYVIYYSQPGNNYKHAIGIATADHPAGPFTDHGKLIDSDEFGLDISIDAYLHQEDGRNWLFWGSFREIRVVELDETGMAIKNSGDTGKTLAGGQYEAAVVQKRDDGYYYLILSTGDYSKGGTYRLVVGRSTNIDGPYLDKGGEDMVLVRHGLVMRGDYTFFSSPGHCSGIITDDDGVDWILYHAYVNEFDYRVLMLDRLDWDENGWPIVNQQNPSRYGYQAPKFY